MRLGVSPGTGKEHSKNGYCCLDVGRLELYSLIDQLSEQEPTELICSAFNVHRSCYYEHRKRCRRIDLERVALKAEVTCLCNQSRSSPGRRTIQGLLNELGEEGTQSDALTRADLYAARTSCLQASDGGAIRYTEPSGSRSPNQVWCGDITYIWTGQCWGYLAFVLDLNALGVMDWVIASNPDADLVVKALEHAREQRGQPDTVMFHSDQGSLYASRLFRQQIWRYRMRQSMSRRGNCWDNAPMERLFRSLESEWVPTMGYRNLPEAKKDISDYLKGYYNHHRPHSHNGGTAPAVAEENLNQCPGLANALILRD